MSKNFDAISDFIFSLNLDFSIYGFSETWIHENTPHTFKLPGYSFIHNDCKHARGGGVGLLISDLLDFVIRHDILECSDYYESLFIEIVIPRGKKILLSVLFIEILNQKSWILINTFSLV